MTKEELFVKVQDILVNEFELDKEIVTLSAKLGDDLDLDSIDAVDMIVKMKEYIPNKIDPEQFKKVVTLQDVIDVLYPLVQKS